MLVMEEDKAASGLHQQRNARRVGLAFAALVSLTWAHGACASPKHFDLPAGDARVMLNRFSEQSEIQLLFDFTQLTGKNTNEVVGDYEPEDALRMLLHGLPVNWEFVNDRTLALTLNADDRASRLRRWWQRVTAKPQLQQASLLDQVTVAGSSGMYQAPPLGASLIRLDRLDIERSGFATTQDLVRTLPQVFGGGPSEDTSAIGREEPTNSSKGVGINLRGLDAGATLVLIDGQRLAPSGGVGLFTDVSNIPLSAIDHIDVLPDGAAAQFGADAIGGVVNFVLRSNFVGAEATLRHGDFNGNALGGRQFSQLLGGHWGESSTAMFGFEWYDRGALPASDRLLATSDLVPFGGSNFNSTTGTPGTLAVGSQTWALPAGVNGRTVANSNLVAGTQNLHDSWTGVDVQPDQERWSAFGTLRSAIADGLELFADSLFTRRRMEGIESAGNSLTLTVPTSNPFYFNPDGGAQAGVAPPVMVETGTQALFGKLQLADQVDIGSIKVGVTGRLPHSWEITGHLGYTFDNEFATNGGLYDFGALSAALLDSDPATALDPFGDAAANNPTTLATIARYGVTDSRSSLKLIGLTAEGPLARTAAGDVRLTVGTEFRRQIFDEGIALEPVLGSSIPLTRSELSRNIKAEFAEVRIPVFGAANSRPLLHALELSFGGRAEQYSDVGQAAVPKASFLWSPVRDLTFRGTWTRSFRPPVLSDVASGNSFSGLTYVSNPSTPQAPPIPLLFAVGNNPNLQDERSRTWTLGVQLAPASAPRLSLAVTYFNTSYTDRIDSASLQPDFLFLPQFSWLVNRNFTAAQRAQVCGETTFAGPPGACLTAPIDAILDNRLRNIERLQTSGIDVIGKYGFANSLGRFDVALNGSYLLDYAQQRTPGDPLEQLLDTPFNPINLRFRGSLSWERAGWGASLFVNFDNSYHDVLSDPNREIRSFTTLDVQLRYRTSTNSAWFLANTEVALTAQNLFNSSPPFFNNPLGVGYDQENTDLTGRILSVNIRKRW
jgi:iron complex outermembrane recepter protein